MAQGDLSGFDQNRNVGGATLPCQGGQKTASPASQYWIEIEMVGEDGSPCPDVRFRVEGPDGSVKEGSLNRLGFARIPLKQSGNCKVSFPELDTDAWDRPNR